MNMTISVGLLLLGVIDPSGRPVGDVEPRFEQSKPGGQPDMTRTRTGSGAERGTQPRTTRQGGDEEPVPLAPTDPTLQSPDSPWATPTQSKPGGQSCMGFGTRPYSGSGGNQGMARGSGMTQRSPQRSSRSYGSTSAAGRPVFRPNIDLTGMQQAPTPRAEMGPKPQAAGTQLNKPFANYTAPSGVSPYQSLYNFNPNGSISDNYNQFVRPQLDQQRANRVVGGEIRGLQSNARLAAGALQRLGKKADNLGGTMAPEYFQNLGNYYPSLAH